MRGQERLETYKNQGVYSDQQADKGICEVGGGGGGESE